MLTLRVTSRALCVWTHVCVVLSCGAAYVCVLSLFLFVAGTLHTIESKAAALSQTARSQP